jgi:response regulator RpfG family c-di-GMP phosphodiesterase
MNTKILCVDDELNVLEAFKRSLRKDFDISVAEGGEEGLAMIESDGPFAVVVSDMRMPGMDGLQFLNRVKDVAPDTVKIMLTGNSDQQTAMDAVNESNIFRFLSKPCPPESLARALKAGLEQYRLITAEKDLLEQTLNQSLHVLVDILAIVNPTAFSRASRVKKMARDIADAMELKNSWQIELAAMLSQIGCVTVPEEILQKIASGTPLSNKETGLYHQHPQIGHDLIARIPRMEMVADIVADQNRRFGDESVQPIQTGSTAETVLSSRILKVVLDFDKLIIAGNTPLNAMQELSGRVGWYDPQVLIELQVLLAGKVDDFVCHDLTVQELKPGMVLDGALNSTRGSILLPAGQEITLSLILRLANLVEAGIVTDRIRVLVPAGQAHAVAGFRPN